MKDILMHYLQRGRDALLWKLDGLGEYDIRRPMVDSGTNLLGLVKHVASVESEYLGSVIGSPFPEPKPWFTSDEPDVDMWATADESREFIVDFYRRVWAHSNATVAALELDAVAVVPWWPEERRTTTLGRILVHLISETQRHAGHADIVRELIDGATGDRAGLELSPNADNWSAHRARLEDAAKAAAAAR